MTQLIRPRPAARCPTATRRHQCRGTGNTCGRGGNTEGEGENTEGEGENTEGQGETPRGRGNPERRSPQRSRRRIGSIFASVSSHSSSSHESGMMPPPA